MSIIKDVIQLGDQLGVDDVIKDIFGGGSKRKSCGQKERELAALIERLFDPREIKAMLQHRTFPWTDRRPGITRPRYDAGALAFYMLGGSNCRAERSDERRFREYVLSQIDKKKRQLESPSTRIPRASATSSASATSTAPSFTFQENTLGILMIIGLLVGVFALNQN